MSETIEIKKEEPKSEDKKDIEMEEREKMLNAENKANDENAGSETNATTSEEKKGKSGDANNKDGMEVKPKKIPIGGIQMPGFFTRSKSKERCKDDDQESQATELIEAKEGNKTDIPPAQTQSTRIKLPNPFRKSKLINEEDTNQTEAKDKKKLLNAIRLPLVSVWPRRKTSSTDQLENQGQAGLASMETLDDKSTDGKSATAVTVDGENMKNVVLDEKKDLELQAVELITNWRETLHNYRYMFSAILVLILLTIIIIIVSIPETKIVRVAPIKDGKYVDAVTSCGKVEGLVEDSAVAFRGIPYARPPLGELRFKYAQPLNKINYCWNGTFLAHNSTPTCLQIHGNGTISGTENCLTLDVVTPYVRYENPLPVIVLIGAESLMGGSPGKMRPSARYARSKDVVFVRPNFRLGALGFLSLATLTTSDYPMTSGNYGLSDILAALKWIQLNIEHFGGDKHSVTLFGHRAGATLVTALTAMPKAEKYFARAWASSGGAIYPKKPRHEAEIENRSYLEIIECQNSTCLRALDGTKITSAVQDTWRKPQPDLPLASEDPAKRHEWLVVDGQIIQENPLEIWQRNNDNAIKVKLVLGTTAHCEATEKLLLKHKKWTDGLVKQHVNGSFLTSKNLTAEALKRYNATYKGLSAMISDIRTICPLFELRKHMHNVHFYVVTQTRGVNELADVDSDVDAILGRYEPKTPEQKRYFSAIQNLFYHFVYFGKVEHNLNAVNQVLIVGQDVLPNATYSHCDFWTEKNVLQYAALD